MPAPHIDVINVIASIVSQLDHLQILKYVTVSGLALLCYDYFLTLESEINFVWPSKWGIPKVLYLLNRYLAFWDAILLTYTALIGGEKSFCEVALQVCGYAASYGIVIAEVILMMRTWAVWHQARAIAVLLGILLVIDALVPAFVDKRFFDGFSVIPNLSPKMKGCLYSLPNRFVYVDFVMVIISESITLFLLITKTFKSYRHSESRSPVLSVIFRDGIIYFIAILCASVTNLIAILVAPIEMCIFLIITQRVLHSCCCTRVILHIREAPLGNVAEYSITYPARPNTTVMPRFEGFGDTTLESGYTEDSDVALADMKGKAPESAHEKPEGVV